MSTPKKATRKRKLSSEYYNASHFRIDKWNKLKSVTESLAKTEKHSKKLLGELKSLIEYLQPVENYWAFPGADAVEKLIKDAKRGDYKKLHQKVSRVAAALLSGEYRRKHIKLDALKERDMEESSSDDPGDYADFERARERPYFEVLIVDAFNARKRDSQREALLQMRRKEDKFTYAPVFVSSFEDALIAVSLNHNVQSVIIRFGFDTSTDHDLPVLRKYLDRSRPDALRNVEQHEYGPLLANTIAEIRPELDLFLVTDQAVEDVAGSVGSACRRVFYSSEDFFELHLNILRGLEERYQTPFFTALKNYSAKPTGVFHALPVSRGKSIMKSHWIQDMGEFYGLNIFLAETSCTSGGLDSLLEPSGPIKEAQDLAARAFGANQTFFATNGTSTCNKIVVQSLVRDGDIVLVDRDCHKSHHYGMVLAGAEVVYLESYPLTEYTMYGAVPLRTIKEKLLRLKAEGKLDRVKMLLLTNCTFDGIVYNVQRVMEECLAIKPDLVFLWDEAWFGFARFGPTYRHRTAMHAAGNLRRRYQSAEHREQFVAQQKELATVKDGDFEPYLERRLLADPDKVRVRVYATQSTHKTLTALRQGSMIHVHDQDYKTKVEESFHEAFMTHTSTSPNYQILASLDLGRRQVELEGFELVRKQVELAMVLRQTIRTHPKLSKYFKLLTVGDMIPEEYRKSGIESYYEPEHGWPDIWGAWEHDEFCLDATRITLLVGDTGMDGDTFKNKILMDKYGIQINKTSRNSVLFMTNIGTTRSSVAFLIEALVSAADEIERQLEDMSPAEKRVHERKVKSIVEDVPPLPDFSAFHSAFLPDETGKAHEADIRSAFFLSYDVETFEYIMLDDPELDALLAAGNEPVSASFVIPYPPGFPVLVPGQIISAGIVEYLRKLDVTEIHGYRPELGLRVYKQSALEASKQKRIKGA